MGALMESSQAKEITIPILPCRSINEMLEFYRALGFEVIYQQSKPNTYDLEHMLQ